MTPRDSSPEVSPSPAQFPEPPAEPPKTSAFPEQPAKPEGSSLLSKLKTGLSALVLIALSGGIGYGVGLMQTRSQIQAVTTEKDRAIAEVQTQLTAAEATAAAATARSDYSQVQLTLLKAMDELEQRNFGNANTQLRLASETLGKIELSKDPTTLAKLKQELANAEINFAVNPVEQRKLMLGYSEQINALLPE